MNSITNKAAALLPFSVYEALHTRRTSHHAASVPVAPGSSEQLRFTPTCTDHTLRTCLSDSIGPPLQDFRRGIPNDSPPSR